MCVCGNKFCEFMQLITLGFLIGRLRDSAIDNAFSLMPSLMAQINDV